MENESLFLNILESLLDLESNFFIWKFFDKRILSKSPNLEEFLLEHNLNFHFVVESLFIYLKQYSHEKSKQEYYFSLPLESDQDVPKKYLCFKNRIFHLKDELFILTRIYPLEKLLYKELVETGVVINNHLVYQVLLDKNFHYIYSNHSYQLHIQEDLDIKKNFFEIHQSDEFFEYLNDFLKTEKEYFLKNFSIKTKFQTNYYDIFIKKIHSKVLGTDYIFLQFTDQTEKVFFRDKERVNQNLYYSIFDNLFEGVVCIDTNGKILLYNQSFSKMFGYEHSELVYKNINILINILMPSEIAKVHDEFLKNYLQGKRRGNIVNNVREVQGKKKNGEIFPLELKVTEISHNDSLLFLGVMRDLTQEKKISKIIQEKEQEIYRLHNMELLGKMSAGIIHDISNFLQPLLLYTEMAENEIKYHFQQNKLECSGEVFKNLEKIKEFALNIKNFTTEILNFTKSIQPPKEKIPFAIHAKEILEMFEIKYRECIFHLDIQDSNRKVFISNESVFQIFSNLITNSIHAMEGQPYKEIFVSIKVSPIDITLFPNLTEEYKEMFTVEFKDVGKGIPEENLSKIFEPFFTTKEKKKGTGLGLSIVNEIIKRHKGKIFVESEVEKGTLFKIFLLIASEKDESFKKKLPKKTPITIPKNATILILEPNEEVRYSLVKYLSFNHFEKVFSYSTYEEFLKYEDQTKQKIDFLITEVFESNFEVFLKQFKERYAQSKIILITIKDKNLLGSISHIADYLFYKPITASELFENVSVQVHE